MEIETLRCAADASGHLIQQIDSHLQAVQEVCQQAMDIVTHHSDGCRSGSRINHIYLQTVYIYIYMSIAIDMYGFLSVL